MLSSVADHRDKEDAAVMALEVSKSRWNSVQMSGGGSRDSSFHKSPTKQQRRATSEPRVASHGLLPSESAVDTIRAMWADRLLKERGARESSQGATPANPAGYGDRLVQRRSDAKRLKDTRAEDTNMPRVASMSRPRSSSASRGSPFKKISISQDRTKGGFH
jgi:hypothetical protein